MKRLMAILGCLMLLVLVFGAAAAGNWLGGPILSVIWGVFTTLIVTPIGSDLIEDGFMS